MRNSPNHQPGYTAVAAVDSSHQVIVAAQAHGSGSEQNVLLPIVRCTDALRTSQTIITADAGYHSEANLRELHDAGIPALIADGQMRKRDERFKDQARYKKALRYTERMRQAVDSPHGRQLYGRRMATVEPVFGNLRANKRLDRFTLRGQRKVDTQWQLYCLVHNIEKLAHHGYGS